MPTSPPGRDPRLRPYRAALWVTYFAVTLFGIGLLIFSVARHLKGPPRPPHSGELPTRAALRLCLGDLEELYREQNERAWALGAEFEGKDPLATWNAWARIWERKVDDLTDRCRLDASDREGYKERTELAAARDAMLALHRAYQAQVNRFAQEEGDLANAAAEALAHARQAVGQVR
ncbi:MAG: hypothetical protein HZB56_00385 [Deltaproteobacteria bacterium]|nr:hypothetical protein [Deltaproteobacteria bacterium]